MDRESSLQNWNAFTRPKDKTILSFSGSPTQWPWQGQIHFHCGYVVCLWCMCFCVAEVFFPVLTLYSPRSIVWGLFFFSSLSSCYAVFFFNSTCISLLIILCMIVYVTNNKEP